MRPGVGLAANQIGVPLRGFGGTAQSDWIAANAWRYFLGCRYGRPVAARLSHQDAKARLNGH